ncbi:MAG: LysR family transcriptional regulator [Hyphomicrobiales bacterium]|nr:LysR family transcriptional regulator [Hyphomicrobiales bacterium]MBV8444068.1 LysR family transcriptional regulator [Hyphomicrobiales bacterium]
MNAELSWDEFRLVKAISDSGSLGGAAEVLGLNHSTVFRRLTALEIAVGAPLFERSREGYRPTAAGEEMISLATTMADSIVEFQRKLAGRDVRPTGLLRVTTVETIGQQILPAILGQFQAQYSGVVIELTLSGEILNLSRRDADVAIRVTNDPPETLVGRRLCAVRWAIYYRRDLVAALGSQPLEAAPFIGFAGDFRRPAGRRWIETHVRPGRLVSKVNSVLNMRELAVQGLGAALLPCFLGDVSPALIRLAPPLAELEAGLWILTHSDLRRSARVRAFMDFAGAEIAKQRRLFEGADGEDAVARLV